MSQVSLSASLNHVSVFSSNSLGDSSSQTDWRHLNFLNNDVEEVGKEVLNFVKEIDLISQEEENIIVEKLIEMEKRDRVNNIENNS